MTPPDEPPRSRRPREKFGSMRDAAEAALVDTRGQFRAPLIRQIRRRMLPPWVRWAALGAIIAAVVMWALGVR